MKCEICGKGPAVESVTVYRVNPKGQRGVWRCWQHLSDPQKSDVDPEVKQITAIIEEDNAKHDAETN